MEKREVILTVDGLKIAGAIYVPEKEVPHPTVCICHGIPSGITEPGDGGYPVLAERICSEGFTTFIFNFRGSRNSEGNLDIRGWIRDLKSVIDYLWQQPEIDTGKLVLAGYSAGASVSIRTAANDDRIAGVASCASPAELAFMIKEPARVIQYFRSIGIIRDADFPESVEKWAVGFQEANALESIGRIAPRPLLILHGTQDDLVNVDNAHLLFRAAGEPKNLVLIEGAGHRLRREERAVRALIEWLKANFKSGG